MYSQRDEEQVILNYFEDRVGTFLDVGAYNGTSFSNTHELALRGWSGVCVEASPSCFVKLMKTYAGNPDIRLVLATIATKCSSAFTMFRDSEDAVSTIDEGHYQKWKDAATYRTIWTATVAPHFLYDLIPHPDFLSVDVEGISGDVTKALFIEVTFRPELVCVEVDDDALSLDAFFMDLGYNCIHTTNENHIYRRVS